MEAPPCTVREHVALLARVDGVSQQLCDCIGLRQVLSPVRLDQLFHFLWTFPRAVLIGALFTEGGLVGDCVLQIRNLTFKRRVSEHHLRERNRMVCNLTRIGESHHVLQEVEVTAHERHHHVVGSHINRAPIVHFECWIGQGFL